MSSAEQHEGRLNTVTDNFLAELGAVEDMLFQSTASLVSPLQEMVRARIQFARPRYRAAVVLAAGYDGDERSGRRVYLAAALEMLFVALGIHRLLVEASRESDGLADDADQRSFIGGTILAGDFCFSHAAQMAAKTESPAIVSLFAQALQDVSAYELRGMHGDEGGRSAPGNTGGDELLLQSGAVAACELSGLPQDEQAPLLALAESMVEGITHQSDADGAFVADVWDEVLELLPEAYSLRWQVVRRWVDDVS